MAAAAGMVITLCVPLFASAQTVTQSSTLSDLQAQVAALLGQLAALRAQIGQIVTSSTSSRGMGGVMPGGMGSPTAAINPGSIMMVNPSSTQPMCIQLSRNLSLGSEGSDVSNLQSMLSQQPAIYPSGEVTGYFGPLTQAAVVKFQETDGITSSSVGFVGPLTRNFFMRRCGGPGPAMPPPSSSTPWMPFNGSGTPPIPPRPSYAPPQWMGSSTAPY